MAEDDDSDVEFHLFDDEDDDGNGGASVTSLFCIAFCFVHVWLRLMFRSFLSSQSLKMTTALI
jgi:hypothetical protein